MFLLLLVRIKRSLNRGASRCQVLIIEGKVILDSLIALCSLLTVSLPLYHGCVFGHTLEKRLILRLSVLGSLLKAYKFDFLSTLALYLFTLSWCQDSVQFIKGSNYLDFWCSPCRLGHI